MKNPDGQTDKPTMSKLVRRVQERSREKVEKTEIEEGITNPGKVLPIGAADSTIGRADPPGLESPAVRDKLLETLRLRPVKMAALREVGVSYRDLLAYCRADPDFERELQDATAEGWARVEETAFSEATAGGPKAHKLIEFLLKGRRRDIYGDRVDVRQDTRHEVVINLLPPGATIRDDALPEILKGSEPLTLDADFSGGRGATGGVGAPRPRGVVQGTESPTSQKTISHPKSEAEINEVDDEDD